MMSAPNAMSGRSRRTCRRTPSHRRADAAASCASGSCRRRPAATDGDAASAALPRRTSSRSRSASIESIEDSRSRGSSGTWRRIASQHAERRLAGQVRAVAGDVDPGQHDLAIAAPTSAAPARRPAHRHRARIAAAIGDDAEGAAVIAAVLDLHDGARPSDESVDQMRRRLPTAMMSLTATFRSACRSRLEAARCRSVLGPHLFDVADDAIDFGHGGEIAARSAPRSRSRRCAPPAVRASPADRLARLPHGLGGYRAGIDDQRFGQTRLRASRASPRTR